ncbi:uncharacterized protein V6R79_024751 [Siganus canaliculatus]
MAPEKMRIHERLKKLLYFCLIVWNRISDPSSPNILLRLNDRCWTTTTKHFLHTYTVIFFYVAKHKTLYKDLTDVVPTVLQQEAQSAAVELMKTRRKGAEGKTKDRGRQRRAEGTRERSFTAHHTVNGDVSSATGSRS